MMRFVQYSDNLHSYLKSIIITDKKGNILDVHESFNNVNRHLRDIKSTRGKVMIVGNGGSAAIASHLQNDLCKGTQTRAMVFTETPLLTALSNDISYSAAYPELVNLWTDQGDMLISISSSGNSKNILDAVTAARQKECGQVITLSGFLPGNPLRTMGDINLYVPSSEYGYVELVHSIIAHFISDQLLKPE